MTSPGLHAAIDLGASSARMSAGRLEGDRLVVKEVARLPNAPVRLPDGIHWDLLALHQGMLEALGRLHRDLDEGALWVGVDSWGVDYGLLDVEGRLLGPPFHYRDERTTGLLDELDGLVGLRRIYDATGTQAMAINTICQLLTERGTTAYEAASHLLMVPDLFAYLLTGERRLERTIGSTTELMDARSGQLVDWLFPVLGLRRDMFPPAIEPGEHYGPVLPEVAASVGMRMAPTVVAVASHDTASAVLAVPAEREDFAYVSSGTWSLVGLELDAPVITEASRRANFSNELGYGGTVRFLKNVMGYWMIQESERCWARQGRPVRPRLSCSSRRRVARLSARSSTLPSPPSPSPATCPPGSGQPARHVESPCRELRPNWCAAYWTAWRSTFPPPSARRSVAPART